MEEVLASLRNYEIWIYVLLGLGALFFVRKFILGWQELRGAAFGLERDNAQARLNQAATVLILLITMAVAEFILVSFIAPSIPGAIPLFTPTVDLLVTPTVTLPASLTQTPGNTLATQNPEQTIAPSANGCIPGQVEITSPVENTDVNGLVKVIGTVDILNFAFYKIESKRPDEDVWAILLAGNQPVKAGELGIWDTRRLTPGEYQLSIVPVNTEALSLDRCVVQVRVTSPPAETQEP